MKRKTIHFEDDVIQLVDEWRKQQDLIPSFNQAVNDMIRILMHPVTREKLKEVRENEYSKNA